MFANWGCKVREFSQCERGSVTVEFAIIFPLYVIIFVSMIGFAMAFIRQAVIIHEVNKMARAYAVGFFASEQALENAIENYIFGLSARNPGSPNFAPNSSEIPQVIDARVSTSVNGLVNISYDVPLIGLIEIVGWGRVFAGIETIVWTHNTSVFVEGRGSTQ